MKFLIVLVLAIPTLAVAKPTPRSAIESAEEDIGITPKIYVRHRRHTATPSTATEESTRIQNGMGVTEQSIDLPTRNAEAAVTDLVANDDGERKAVLTSSHHIRHPGATTSESINIQESIEVTEQSADVHTRSVEASVTDPATDDVTEGEAVFISRESPRHRTHHRRRTAPPSFTTSESSSTHNGMEVTEQSVDAPTGTAEALLAEQVTGDSSNSPAHHVRNRRRTASPSATTPESSNPQKGMGVTEQSAYVPTRNVKASVTDMITDDITVGEAASTTDINIEVVTVSP